MEWLGGPMPKLSILYIAAAVVAHSSSAQFEQIYGTLLPGTSMSKKQCQLIHHLSKKASVTTDAKASGSRRTHKPLN